MPRTGNTRKTGDKTAPAAGVRPEAQLLLAVARECEESERAERLRALLVDSSSSSQDGLDWPCLLECADHNRMLSLLYWRLADAAPDALPKDAREMLDANFRRASVNNMRLTMELVAILRLMQADGIAAVPLKGPMLALSLYGNLALRQFWDIDIMVHVEDVARATQILIERGYVSRFAAGPAEEEKRLKKESEHVFDRASDNMHVEIHWRVLPKSYARGFDTDHLWDRLAPARCVDWRQERFRPEDLLLFLCVHGGDKHLWHRLKWICDVARLVAVHKDMDWDAAISRAAQLKRKRTIFLGLHLAHTLLDAPVPASVSEEIRKDSMAVALGGLVRGRLFREGHGLPGFAEWLVYMGLAERQAKQGGVGERLRYLRAVMKPESGDMETMPLPAALSFAHYLWRPIRLFARRGGDLVDRVR